MAPGFIQFAIYICEGLWQGVVTATRRTDHPGDHPSSLKVGCVKSEISPLGGISRSLIRGVQAC